MNGIITWHRASTCQNTECVEVDWHSMCANGHDCVEVGLGACGMVHVRDSKDRAGAELTFTRQEWAEFLARPAADRGDR